MELFCIFCVSDCRNFVHERYVSKSVKAYITSKMSEKLCLKWKDFQENVNAAFGSLREDNEFADVTLACEDGQQIEAHKVILAASSPFFQALLRRNRHPHPLIFSCHLTAL